MTEIFCRHRYHHLLPSAAEPSQKPPQFGCHCLMVARESYGLEDGLRRVIRIEQRGVGTVLCSLLVSFAVLLDLNDLAFWIKVVVSICPSASSLLAVICRNEREE